MDKLEKRFYYLLGQPGVVEAGRRVEVAKQFAAEARKHLSWQRPRDLKGHFVKQAPQS